MKFNIDTKLMNKFFGDEIKRAEYKKWHDEFIDSIPSVKPISNQQQMHNEQYDKWLSNEIITYDHDIDQIRSDLLTEFNQYILMDVKEYTLHEKYNEIHTKYNVQYKNTLFGKEFVSSKSLDIVKQVKSNIWIPEHYNDYLKLQPKLILCNGDDKLNRILTTLKTFISTGKNNSNIGRNLFYLVVDDITGKYLGAITASSDYLDLSCRDDKIGWSREQRNSGMINHSCVGSSIVPTQPLGFNYLGGKLLTLLLSSKQVQDDWKRLYGDTLVMIDTTSLYGSFSQYNSLKYWKKIGKSKGTVIFRPKNQDTIYRLKEWMKSLDPRDYWDWMFARIESGRLRRDHINRFFQLCFRKLEITRDVFTSGFKRGVYMCELYTNTKEFLRGEITEDELIPKFDNSTKTLTQLWKDKYATKRIIKLVADSRTMDDTLFYDDIVSMSWDDVKIKYLKQVGR